MPKINLKKDDLKKISSAVKDAESKTSGEIATAIIKESYNYAVYELLFAVTVGFIYFVVMMFFVGSIENRLQSLFWDYHIGYLLIFYGFSTFLVIALFYFLGNISTIDRLIVSKKIKWQKVKERALRQFMESGVYNTKDRTGILIFISILEKRVELLADSGINEKIPQEKWQSIVDNIIKGIKKKNVTSYLIESINECGELLAQHFPIQPGDVNELTDEINILEK
ncbi:MAG: TPM domain-containing protein [Candidatus Cloacimonetes bacterium]|nr:TPM domain-containing protein [Candidatus Cloacimonadota bacterium]MBL7149106.1 TPM domain-containing protein [Candidatus Cloacimonadota bacterium]